MQAPAGAKAPAAVTIAVAATWHDFSDGKLGPDSKDDNLGLTQQIPMGQMEV